MICSVPCSLFVLSPIQVHQQGPAFARLSLPCLLGKNSQTFGRLGGGRKTMGRHHGDSCVGQTDGPYSGRISGLFPSGQDDRADDR